MPAEEPPSLGHLLVLAGDPPALVVALLAGHGTQDTGQELAVVGREVGIAGHGGHRRDPGGLADVEELLELPRAPVEPVEVPDHDGVDDPGADVVEHPAVLGRGLPARR